MAMLRDLRQLPKLLEKVEGHAKKAQLKAMIQTLQIAKKESLINIKKFQNTQGRRRTGGLAKALFTEADIEKGKVVGRMGSQGIPYGAIHEFGGVVKHKKAQNLWLKQYTGGASKFKNMTPREFVEKMRRFPGNFKIFKSKKGNLIAAFTFMKHLKKSMKTRMVPLFVLKKQVEIPPRPYIRPALERSMKSFPGLYRDNLTLRLGRMSKGSGGKK